LHYGHVPSRKQQSLWPIPIFRCRPSHEHSVYGQGLRKVRHDGRLGVRSLQRRQTWRRDFDENLRPVSRSGQSSRPCLHPLRTLNPENDMFVRPHTLSSNRITLPSKLSRG
jgi:hypothetical protein